MTIGVIEGEDEKLHQVRADVELIIKTFEQNKIQDTLRIKDALLNLLGITALDAKIEPHYFDTMLDHLKDHYRNNYQLFVEQAKK